MRGPVRGPVARGVVVSALLLSVAVVPTLQAQTPAQPPDPAQPQKDEAAQLMQFRQQVEMWIRSGQSDRAIELLEARRARGPLEPSLSRRLASLYRETARYDELERFLLEENDGDLDRADVGQLRMLAEANFRRGKDAAAREVLDRILARDPGDPALLRLVATVLSQNERALDAIEILRESREEEKDPTLYAQLLARLHTQVDQPAEAVAEFALVVVSNPLNLALVRGQVLSLVDRWPGQLEDLVAALGRVQRQYPDTAQLRLLAAELHLRAGDADAAWRDIEDQLENQDMAQDLLRLALAGLADSRTRATFREAEVLTQEEAEEGAMRRLRFSARIAKGLLEGGALPRSLEPRAWDTFTRTLMALLENPAFLRQDASEQLQVLERTREAILTMQRKFSGNRLTASALLRLAELYSTSLHRPRSAIEIYRRLADDPNATTENLQLARMGLAESHVALGDTATARTMFEEIGQDMSFVEGQGKAQYYLGQIEFMSGNFDVAEDRLKAVAVESPQASYANDALDLALLLAEEKMAGQADEEALRHYGRMLYFRATDHEDQGREELRAILHASVESPIRARARYDLARLERSAGHPEVALALVDELAARAPSSRYLAPALEWKGQVLESLGREDEAMHTYEQLLVDHEDYVQLDRVRDRIRALVDAGVALGEEGDLP